MRSITASQGVSPGSVARVPPSILVKGPLDLPANLAKDESGKDKKINLPGRNKMINLHNIGVTQGILDKMAPM